MYILHTCLVHQQQLLVLHVLSQLTDSPVLSAFHTQTHPGSTSQPGRNSYHQMDAPLLELENEGGGGGGGKKLIECLLRIFTHQ